MKFVLQSKTGKYKSTEIFPPLLLKPTDICVCAMLRAKKCQQKVSILPLYRSYYSMVEGFKE